MHIKLESQKIMHPSTFLATFQKPNMEIWRFFLFPICQFRALSHKRSMSIFSSKISPLCFKISNTTHSKDFCEMSVPNPLDLEDFFFPEIFRQQILACCKKYTKILKIVYFPL